MQHVTCSRLRRRCGGVTRCREASHFLTQARQSSPTRLPTALDNCLALKRVAVPEWKNLALERPTAPREVGLFNPDAEGEGEEPAEIDLVGPSRLPLWAICPSVRSAGKIRAH
jgi:hypothetical protein